MANCLADLRDPENIRKRGLEALNKELGPTGTAYFIHLYDQGKGDYTKERHAILENMSFDDVRRKLYQLRELKGRGPDGTEAE